MTRPTEEQERLVTLVGHFQNKKILVVGDAVADQFIYGEISRVSREAPVLILRHERTETVPGGAANCALNLASLGASVALLCVVGNDEAGRQLTEKLKNNGVDCSGILVSESQTTTKVRILAGQLHSTRQQVIRIDYDDTSNREPLSKDLLNQQLRKRVSEADAVIISDYNYGVVGEAAVSVIREISRTRGTPVLVDSRFKLTSIIGFTSATPNADEVEQLLGVKLTGHKELISRGDEMRARLDYRALLVTLGGEGMILFEEGIAPLHIAAVGGREPVDPTGAGDTVMAAYTLAVASGGSFQDAARLANHAGGLVVMKRGTASITPAELQHSILSSGNTLTPYG